MVEKYGAHGSVFTCSPFTWDDEDEQRFRPVKAVALLHNLSSKGKAEHPLAFLSADTQYYDLMEGFDKGHLIGNQFINENGDFDIVPVYSSFNQKGGVWSGVESAIQQSVAERNKVTLTIEIEYNGTDGRIPSAFVVTAATATGFVSYNGLNLNAARIVHLPTPAIQLSYGNVVEQLGSVLGGHLFLATHLSGYFDFKAENLYLYSYRINRGSLAPIETIPRPYAFLDQLWLEQPGCPIQKYLGKAVWVGGKGFSPRQKTLIRMANRLFNGGYLRSDYPNDTKDNLIEGSGHQAAQVDHVWPQSAYGPNLFSNAMIASGKFNNTASAKGAIDKYQNHNAV
jgi:hypothetical protein